MLDYSVQACSDMSASKLLDGIAGAEDAAFEDTAQHAAAAPEFLPQSRPDALHLIARRAHQGDFQERLTHSKALPNLEAVHLQAVGRDVLSQNAGLQFHGVERFAVHKQDLPIAPRPSMRAPL